MNYISKYIPSQKTLKFPYIQITGVINRQTTLFVQTMINRLPSNIKKIGLVINSDSGSVAQAHIINQKLNVLVKKNNIQLYSFIQDSAINAAFLIAMNSHKIYADRTSIIGGVQVNTQKVILNDMINRIVYKNQSSLYSQLNHNESINKQKKQQLQQIYIQFSKNIQSQVIQKRKLTNNIDLKQLYNGQQAKNIGLVHQIGRINQIVPKQFKQYQLKKMQQNQFDQIRNDLRKLDFW